MRRAILFFTLSSITLTVAAALPVSAFATDARQAISMCDKRGPDCTIQGPNDKGDTVLCVNNTGGKQCVTCPLQGNCSPLGSRGASKGKIGSVSGVLSGSVGNAQPKGKKPVVGSAAPPKSVGVKSLADSQSEKHRINTSQHPGSGSHK